MLHKRRVLKTLYGNSRRHARIWLGIKPRPRTAPVLSQSLEDVVERHGWIARSLLDHAPGEKDWTGQRVCEIGSGDCLAAAALFLEKGASHVDMVEVEPPFINQKQLDVLNRLKQQGLPIDPSIIQPGTEMSLDAKRVEYHRCYMEHYKSEQKHDFLFSFSVVEHVEDLTGFYSSCHKTLKPGGGMLHIVDLGGHHLFEDPLPPLDFQTYPDWLFHLMYPKFDRATRVPFARHLEIVRQAGFQLEPAQIRRKASLDYLEQIWPRLRPQMRQFPKDEVGVIEFALLARKPA